jgi:hypothetical protein
MLDYFFIKSCIPAIWVSWHDFSNKVFDHFNKKMKPFRKIMIVDDDEVSNFIFTKAGRDLRFWQKYNQLPKSRGCSCLPEE